MSSYQWQGETQNELLWAMLLCGAIVLLHFSSEPGWWNHPHTFQKGCKTFPLGLCQGPYCLAGFAASSLWVSDGNMNSSKTCGSSEPVGSLINSSATLQAILVAPQKKAGLSDHPIWSEDGITSIIGYWVFPLATWRQNSILCLQVWPCTSNHP